MGFPTGGSLEMWPGLWRPRGDGEVWMDAVVEALHYPYLFQGGWYRNIGVEKGEGDVVEEVDGVLVADSMHRWRRRQWVLPDC